MLGLLNLLKYLCPISLIKQALCSSSSLRVPSRVCISGGVPCAAWDDLLAARDAPGSSMGYIAVLAGGMHCSSEAHSLFASSSKLNYILQCCCLIFLDRLVQ